MKKYFLFTLIFIIFSFIFLNCEETTLKRPEEYNVLDNQLEFEIYEIENTHSENKDVKVVIYYYPLYKQLRIVYESPYDSYSYDDAIVSLKYCLEEFTIKCNGINSPKRLKTGLINFIDNYILIFILDIL